MKQEERWLKIPLKQLTKPSNGMHNVYVNHWWVVDEQDNAVFFKHLTSPQCHPSPEMVKRMSFHSEHEGKTTVKKVPLAFVPINMSDYLS